MRVLLCVVSVMLVAGCTTTANMERSLLRGAGDTSITAVADGKEEADVQALVDGTRSACVALLVFFNTGNVSALTTAELEAKLLSLVDDTYSSIVAQALAVIKSVQVDVDGRIGARNVKRVRAVINGVLRGALEYEVTDR